MSEMPDRIWATETPERHRLGGMRGAFSEDLYNIHATRYVRADIADGQLERSHAFYREQAESCRELIAAARCGPSG